MTIARKIAVGFAVRFVLIVSAVVLTALGMNAAGAATAPARVGAGVYFADSGDSGHGGIWADDTFSEAMVVTQLGNADPSNCGGNSPCWKFSVTATDNGSFGTRNGAGTPNQSNPGHLIAGHVPGTMTGKLDWGTFYADTLPLASRVVAQVNNHGLHVDGQTGAMPKQFFPHTVTNGVTDSPDVFGLSLDAYDFEYAARCFPAQHWSDTSANDDGNLPGDGNITGGRSCSQLRSFAHLLAKPSLKNVGGFTPSTAVTNVSSTGVSGGNGVWSNAKFKRTATVTGGADVPVANCAPQAVDCYIYQINITDKGTFKTVLHAFRPNQIVAGKRISGVVTGSVTSSYVVQFYSSGVPHEEIVPGGKSGNLDTAHWYKLFFGAGTRFGTAGLASPVFTSVYSGCGQKWTVTNTNHNGQIASAGNIKTGATC